MVPGIASPDEAEDNAAAGYAPLGLDDERREAILQASARMRLALCCRCGACEPTCSRGLPIASMFRDAYIWNYRNETFMADDQENYFDLHPDAALACASCDDRTCRCPQGLDVPGQLEQMHTLVGDLRRRGAHPGPIKSIPVLKAGHDEAIRIVSREVPSHARPGQASTATFLMENAGDRMWMAHSHIPDPHQAMAITIECGGRRVIVPLRQNISPGQRSPVAVEFMAPAEPGDHDVAFFLTPMVFNGAPRAPFLTARLRVEAHA